MSRVAAVAAVVLVPALFAAPPGGAADVGRERLQELAARATDDPAALAELRSVDSVDGRPTDLRRLLEDADADELEGRLRVLATDGRPPVVEGNAARREARAILSERRFREHELPRPFRGALEWLGDRVRPLVDAAARLVDRIGGPLPGGRSTFWLLVAAGLVTLAAVLASQVVRTRAREAVERARAAAAGPVDPRRLEREADEAERRGELEWALRLRFRAGLIRLQRAEVIPPRESLTSGEVARRLRSAEFDRLAATFDEVVYGRRQPRADDVEASRTGWTRVLGAALP